MMKWRNYASGILFLLCICTNTHARVFYVDTETGDDNHSGRSPLYAWKTLRQVNITTFEPDDSILFCSGQEWLGMLWPRGSGAPGKPIVISKYGGVEKPKIHGGHADPVEFEGHRTIQTVFLHNQQHWVISNLEITNMPDNIIEDFDSIGNEKRRGIYVLASDTGELKGITICNNYIHHVCGDETKDFYGSGGIIVAVLGKRKPSFFNGVQIYDNRLYMVSRTGIGISSYWQRRPRNSFYPKSWMDKMGPYQANLNVVIRNNDLERIGGDGIVPQTSFKALMEHNRVNGAASCSKGYNAGLWAWNSDSVLIQYNEVWNTRNTRDGMAFDCDAYSVGHVYQYNYSHHNDGGFLLLFGHSQDVPDAENVGHVIRYNISMNDGNSLLHFYGSGHTQSIIHNNLFYNDNSLIHPVKVEGTPQDIKIHNNIFHMANISEWGRIHSLEFLDNLFFGFFPNEMLEKHNTFRTPVLEDLHHLFDHKHHENTAGIGITCEDIESLWENILEQRNMQVTSGSLQVGIAR